MASIPSSMVFSMWEDANFNTLRMFWVLHTSISLASLVHPDVTVRMALGPGGLLVSNHADLRKLFHEWRALDDWLDAPPVPIHWDDHAYDVPMGTITHSREIAERPHSPVCGRRCVNCTLIRWSTQGAAQPGQT